MNPKDAAKVFARMGEQLSTPEGRREYMIRDAPRQRMVIEENARVERQNQIALNRYRHRVYNL